MMWNAQEYGVLLGCFCTGIVIGLLYDFFSLLSFPFLSVIVDAVFDTLFYLCVLLLCAAALFVLNDGKVRFYSLFSVLTGCYAYMRFPSRLIRGILRRIRQKFIKK